MGVVLALILVIVALLAAMCVLCERHYHNKKERTKRRKIALEAQKTEVGESCNVYAPRPSEPIVYSSQLPLAALIAS